jgi:hypothetical protein
MMTMRWLMAASLAAFTTAATPLAAQTPATVAGEWVIDTERSQDPMEVMAAARGGGGGMAMRSGGGEGRGGNMMIRGGAGGPLIGMLRTAERLRIGLIDSEFTLQTDEDRSVRLPVDGAAHTVNRWEQQLQARARLEDGAVILETGLPNGSIVKEVFSTGENGELIAELHVPLPMGGGEPRTAIVRRVYVAAP